MDMNQDTIYPAAKSNKWQDYNPKNDVQYHHYSPVQIQSNHRKSQCKHLGIPKKKKKNRRSKSILSWIPPPYSQSPRIPEHTDREREHLSFFYTPSTIRFYYQYIYSIYSAPPPKDADRARGRLDLFSLRGYFLWSRACVCICCGGRA